MQFCNFVFQIFLRFGIIKSGILNAISHYEFNPIVDGGKKKRQQKQTNNNRMIR